MVNPNSKVDKYLIDGCMRCKFGATPKCKVNNWRVELETLRQLALQSNLTEELKWGVPCYTFNNKNVILIAAFKDYVSLSFFKGALLTDDQKVLQKHGESSQAVRFLKYTTTEQIVSQAEIIKSYISEAIRLEESEAKIEFKKQLEPLPLELINIFNHDPELKSAFNSLTPGRQRGYIIYFSQPKQSQTRVTRIEKYRDKIINGEGLNDKYTK